MEQIGKLLNQVISREQALPVSKPLETGNEFQLAVRGDKICNLMNVEPIKQALRFSMVLVGLRAANLPNEEETKVLIEYIQKYYGGHTAAEIKLAFEMAVAGKLDVEQVSCYENFTPLYFSSIMNAYREWAKVESKQVQPQVEQRIYTAEELEAIQRWDIEAFYQRCLKGIIPPPQLPEYFVTILNKDGIEVKDDNEAQQYFAWCINNGVRNLYIKK